MRKEISLFPSHWTVVMLQPSGICPIRMSVNGISVVMFATDSGDYWQVETFTRRAVTTVDVPINDIMGLRREVMRAQKATTADVRAARTEPDGCSPKSFSREAWMLAGERMGYDANFMNACYEMAG